MKNEIIIEHMSIRDIDYIINDMNKNNMKYKIKYKVIAAAYTHELVKFCHALIIFDTIEDAITAKLKYL